MVNELSFNKKHVGYQQAQPVQNDVLPLVTELYENRDLETLIEPEYQIPKIEKWSLLPRTDPFIVSYKEFLLLTIDEVKNMYNIVQEIFKESLEEKWSEGYKHAIICGREIKYVSREHDDYISKIIDTLSLKEKKACYIFSAPDVEVEPELT